ncbi:MAG: phosphocholine cytidylyltransferase family protein [Nannocystaceae bacterium]
MKGIILAAGRGSRMGCMTDARPKCLTVLAGRSLLDWQLSALKCAGVRDVTVIRGYRKECLRGPGYHTADNERWAETNMVATLQCAHDLLAAGPVVVSYGDIVYHPEHLRALAAARAPIAITYDTLWRSLWGERFEDPSEDVETFEAAAGRLQEIGGRPTDMDAVQGQYMGLLRFTPSGWGQVLDCLAALPAEGRPKLDMTSLLRALLTRDVEIETVGVDGGWCEVDCAQDVAIYTGRLRQPGWAHDWRWSES